MTTPLSTSVFSTSAHLRARDSSFKISSRTVSLTFSVSLKPGNNPVTFHNSTTLLLLGLFTFVNPVAQVAEKVLPVSVPAFSSLECLVNIKDIDTDVLTASLDNILNMDTSSSPDELAASFTHSAPWFTPELRLMKTKAHQLK
ncbi:hypothetical protein MHYP_G00043230 [Metynnis hypsauchen]